MRVTCSRYCQLFQCPWMLVGTGPCPGQSRPVVNKRNNHKPTADPEDPLRLAAPRYLVSARMWLQIPCSHAIISGLPLEGMASYRGGGTCPSPEVPTECLCSQVGSQLPMPSFSKALRNVLRGCFCHQQPFVLSC